MERFTNAARGFEGGEENVDGDGDERTNAVSNMEGNFSLRFKHYNQ